MFTYTNTAKGCEFTVQAETKKALFAKIEAAMGCPMDPSIKRFISRQIRAA
jgi:hypothetical protein